MNFGTSQTNGAQVGYGVSPECNGIGDTISRDVSVIGNEGRSETGSNGLERRCETVNYGYGVLPNETGPSSG